MTVTFDTLSWSIIGINCGMIVGVGFFLLEFGWFAVVHLVLGSLGVLVIFDKYRNKSKGIKNGI